jgi:hypothetical protein
MSYSHNFKTMEITGIQALTFALRIEVDTGFKWPYKQSHLQRELLSLQLPLNPNGSFGEVFIDGAHEILTGPDRGNVQLLFQNTNTNEIFVDRISGSFAAHLYRYLRKEKGYMIRCCQKMLSGWLVMQDALQASSARLPTWLQPFRVLPTPPLMRIW